MCCWVYQYLLSFYWWAVFCCVVVLWFVYSPIARCLNDFLLKDCELKLHNRKTDNQWNVSKHRTKEDRQIAKNPVKRCSASFVIVKYKLEPLWDIPSYPIRMAFQKRKIKVCWWSCGEIRTLELRWQMWKVMQLFWKSLKAPQKLKHRIILCPAILLLVCTEESWKWTQKLEKSRIKKSVHSES